MRFFDLQGKKRSPSRAKASIFDVVGRKMSPPKSGSYFFIIPKLIKLQENRE